MAEPLSSADKAAFKKLASLFCTRDEIADMLGMTASEFESAVVATYGQGFDEASAPFRAEGCRNLRAAQVQSALKGNSTMQIWLGKQYLGQSDTGAEAVREEPAHDKEAPVFEIINRHTERRLSAKSEGGTAV